MQSSSFQVLASIPQKHLDNQEVNMPGITIDVFLPDWSHLIAVQISGRVFRRFLPSIHEEKDLPKRRILVRTL